MDKDEIKARLELVVVQLGQMHEKVIVDAARIGAQPMEIHSTTGEMLLAPIFIAQANALAALAYLER